MQDCKYTFTSCLYSTVHVHVRYQPSTCTNIHVHASTHSLAAYIVQYMYMFAISLVHVHVHASTHSLAAYIVQYMYMFAISLVHVQMYMYMQVHIH